MNFESSGEASQETMPGFDKIRVEAHVFGNLFDRASWEVVEGLLDVGHTANERAGLLRSKFDEALKRQPDFLGLARGQEPKCRAVHESGESG